MALIQAVPRHLEEPARIAGLTPVELAVCALTYAGANSMLRGIPFSSLISLGIGAALAITLLILHRTKPPLHELFFVLALLRKPITPVMADTRESREL